MNKLEEFKLKSSGKIRQWLRQVHTFVGENTPFNYTEEHFEDTTPLLNDADDSRQVVEEDIDDDNENIDVIIKSLREDVLDIVQDVDCQTKPTWIIYKLDTLGNNIRETCLLHYNWMYSPLVRDELLKAQEKYIVHLIEEIMDDIFQASCNMKRRKKHGKERSINSVISVLRILKKEVCRMLNLLKSSDTTPKSNPIADMKSKSVNYGKLVNPIKGILWKENVEYHHKESNEVNVFGSKSYPMCCPKNSYYRVNKNVNFVNSPAKNLIADHHMNSERTSQTMMIKDSPGGFMLPCEFNKELNCEEKVENTQINNAFMYTQYAQETKSVLQHFLSRIVPRKPGVIDNRNTDLLKIFKHDKEASKDTESKILSDASTWTEPDSTSFNSFLYKKDSQCNTTTSYPCKIDISSISSKTNNSSNKLFSKKIAWTKSINQEKPNEQSIISSKCDSLPAIELIRKTSVLQENCGTSQPPKKSISLENDFDSSILEDYSADSDSDENYVSCVPSNADFKLAKVFNRIQFRNPNKKLYTNNFSCKSQKLNEIERNNITDRLVNSKRLSNAAHNRINVKDTYQRKNSIKNNTEYCTLAFNDDKPDATFLSITPEISLSYIDINMNRKLKTDNGKPENVSTKQTPEQFPVCSYLLDSQFSRICMSRQSKESLQSFRSTRNNVKRNYVQDK